MLVSELIDNCDFDFNCSYKIYNCPDDSTTWDYGGILIYDSDKGGDFSPESWKISYITFRTDLGIIVIEVKEA